MHICQSILCNAGQLASPTPNTAMSPVIPHPIITTSVPTGSKATSPHSGLPNPSGLTNPAVTTQHVQHIPLPSGQISQVQQMVPGQQGGVSLGQQQGIALMGNFVPGVSPQGMPINLAMMPPPPAGHTPTCQVAAQPQMMPISSIAHQQHPMQVSGMSQMPVIVSMPPGMDGLQPGMPHLPENIAQMAAGAPMMQMHPIPMTTLPMPPPLQPITCGDMSLPPPLQPLSVMSPAVPIPSQAPVPVSIPPSINTSLNTNERTPQSDPTSPIYEVKLETAVKDAIMEKIDTTNTTPEKGCKAELKCDRVKVENGDDDTIIAENVTIMTETEEQSNESSKSPIKDTRKNGKCSGLGEESSQSSSKGKAIRHSTDHFNGDSL